MPSIGTFVSNPDALLADSKKEHKPAAFGDLTQLAIHTANTAIFLLWSKLLTCLLSRKYQNRSILTNYQLPRCNCEERGKHFWMVTLVMFVRGATRKSCFDDKPTTPPQLPLHASCHCHPACEEWSSGGASNPPIQRRQLLVGVTWVSPRT